MNPLDRSLQRLLNSAARAPAKDPGPGPSLATENAILAEWQSATSADDWVLLIRMFRRAVICSALIMLTSVGCSWFQSRSQASDATELADYAMTIQLPP